MSDRSIISTEVQGSARRVRGNPGRSGALSRTGPLVALGPRGRRKAVRMMTHEHVSTPSPAVPTPASIDAAGSTNVGRERPLNEDAYLIATLQRSMIVHDASPAAARGWVAGASAGTLLVVADGMGGQGGGEVASRVA